MIREADDQSLLRKAAFCPPFACKIQGLAEAYGMNLPFARFWVQESGEEPCCALSLLDGAMVMDAGENADFRELAGFIRAAGCRTLLCAERIAHRMSAKADRTGAILHFSGTAPFPDLKGAEPDPSLREMSGLLCECGELEQAQAESFYLDLSHRVRHGAALTAGIREKERLAACASALSVTEKTAVLSAVAVHPDFRRRGLGTRAVGSLISRLPGRDVFVFCAGPQAERFYASLSFSPWGRWAELDFEKEKRYV